MPIFVDHGNVSKFLPPGNSQRVNFCSRYTMKKLASKNPVFKNPLRIRYAVI